MSVKFYEVGGMLRDKILGVKPKDNDYAVACESFDVMRQAIIDRGGKIFVETPKYLTIRANIPNLGAADFALCRKDGEYNDGRHPDSVSVGSLIDDLARRDFTMNAMARDVDTGEMFDPHNGMLDIQRREIRFVGNPFFRLCEDKLRAFRAVRFMITKEMSLLPATSNAVKYFAHNTFAAISTERIREELANMFAVSTRASFQALFIDFKNLGEVVIERKIRFKPTTAAT